MTDVPPAVVPEPSHARPAGTLPDGAGARRAPATPARPAAARPRLVGAGRGAGAERVRGRSARGAAAVGALPRLAPALAGVAPGRGGEEGALRQAGGGRGLLRAAAALGAGLVAGARPRAGGRRDRAPRRRGGAGGERALPRLGHPGRLGGPAGQRAGRVDGADPAPAAPVAAGRAAGLDGAGAGRPRPVEPAPLGPHPPAGLAPAAAHPAADDDRARRPRALPGRDAGPSRRGLGRPRSPRLAEGPEPDGHPGRGLDGGAGGALGGRYRPAAAAGRGGLVRLEGAGWYALRMCVELSFPAPKGLGRQWQRSRRTDPARGARHWLGLAGAGPWGPARGPPGRGARARGPPP